VTRLDLYVCPLMHYRVVPRTAPTRPDVMRCTALECGCWANAARAEEAFDALLDGYERLALFCDLGASSAQRVASELDRILELIHVAAEHVHADCDANGFSLTASVPIGALMPAIARSAELARSLLPNLTPDAPNHPEN